MAIDTLDRVTTLPDETNVTIHGATWVKRGTAVHHGSYNLPISTLSGLLGQINVPDVPVQEPVAQPDPVTPATTVTYTTGLDPSEVQDALHEYLTDQGGLTGSERQGIVDILEQLGLNLPSEDVTVTVSISGESEVSVQDTYIEENLIGGGVSTVNSTYEMTVDWQRTFEVERSTDDGCGCGVIDQDYCETLISDEGIAGSVEDYTVECNGRACVNG